MEQSSTTSGRDRELIAVSTTVMDSAAGIARFVERNQAAGADLVFVFLDDPTDEILAEVSALAGVIAVDTRGEYWSAGGGERFDRLNPRQMTNVSLANTVCAVVPGIAWLVHLDGDEVLQIDRERLLALPREVLSVVLAPREVVTTSDWDGVPRYAKRLASPEQLQALQEAGAIAAPRLGAYFRGHTVGKPALRPRLDARLGIHRVTTVDWQELPSYAADWLAHLHYESFNGREFARKWTAHSVSGGANFRAERRPLVQRAAEITAAEVDDATRRRMWAELYATERDDLDRLLELGLAEEIRAGEEHRPVPLDAEAEALMRELLERLHRVFKERGRTAISYAEEVRRQFALHSDEPLAQLLDVALGRCIHPTAGSIAEAAAAEAPLDQLPTSFDLPRD